MVFNKAGSITIAWKQYQAFCAKLRSVVEQENCRKFCGFMIVTYFLSCQLGNYCQIFLVYKCTYTTGLCEKFRFLLYQKRFVMCPPCHIELWFESSS